MIPLNTLTFPLSKNALIEASAGTGKTYTISNLYLRLVVGHECQPLTVAQILILTFTNAATAELKERILARIQEALQDFTRGESDDTFIAELLLVLPDHSAAAQRLRIAAQEMDMASVFTIHGFCQRVLSEHAFESGGEWQNSMLLDDSDLIEVAVKDFWRKIVSQLQPGILEDFLSYWSVPENLVSTLRPVIFRDIGNESPEQLKATFLKTQSEFQNNLQTARCWWRENNISQLLADADLKANVKLAKTAFLEMMALFAAGQPVDLGKEGWLTLAPEKVEKARKKSSAVLPLADFERFVLLDKLQHECAQLQKKAFFWEALLFVRGHLAKSKASRSQLAPDDLLQNLRFALETQSENETGQHLARAIKKQYPVSLIDEFQDTDEVQFAIFKAVYLQQSQDADDSQQTTSLILIGDPKQAIYSFRGGDIYTYLYAKKLVSDNALFTLDTNWRSSPELIHAVNQLFDLSNSGFMNKDMPFYPVKAGREAKRVVLNNEEMSALQLAILPSKTNAKGSLEPLKWTEASLRMSQICAQEVATYLKHVNVDGESVSAGDVCILVRDRFEAELIQTALREHHIDSVFLLKETVFKSQVAYSLYLLLNAVMNYKSESAIKAALLDWIMCFNNTELQALTADTVKWQQILSHFHRAWGMLNAKSVMTALDYLFAHFNVFTKLASRVEGSDRVITDIRHLSEILQKQSSKMEGHAALLKWFAQRVADPNLIKADNIEDIQWRLETDQNLVQITTIHASKGLQYPFVFVPFVSRFKVNTSGFYHDEELRLKYDLDASEKVQENIDFERLSEDTRLFYVAVTRAVYHCWLGLWDNNIAGRKVQSGFFQTAFGKLISTPQMLTSDHHVLRLRLSEMLADTATNVKLLEEMPTHMQTPEGSQKQPVKELQYRAAILDKNIEQTWFLTSYSAISKQKALPDADLHAEESFKAEDENAESERVSLTDSPDVTIEQLEMRFRFAKGASPGSYLHEVLEVADFNDKNHLLEKCFEMADKFSINNDYVPGVSDWLWETLQAPLVDFTLQDLAPAQRLPEMEFWLPLYHIDIRTFNELVGSWVPGQQGEYRLQSLNGMLKGYLDLVYTYDGKFYVADYKSNYLGDDYSDYHQEALHQVMLHHDYYLQALLYSLALHRYLKLKIPDYSYAEYIGGAQYLFLRGMSPAYPGCGILNVHPPESVILKLDKLFQEEDVFA